MLIVELKKTRWYIRHTYIQAELTWVNLKINLVLRSVTATNSVLAPDDEEITYLWNVFLRLSLSVYEKGFFDCCCLCDFWIQWEWIWIGREQIWERKRIKNYLLTMTRILKQRRNISESFIFVRENILKSDFIYLLRRDQRCYVYVFMFFSTGQVIRNTWAVPDDRQTNT